MKHLTCKTWLAPMMIFIAFSVNGQKKEAYEMILDGVQVIVQPSDNEIVVIQTIIKGGVQNYPAEKAGIESLALNALTECGTAKDDKNTFKNKLDKISAYVHGNTGMDFASFTMNCIKGDFDFVWPLYVDALTAPRFDKKEFERIKQDAINTLKSKESQPDYAIDKMARQTAFAGKNYAKAPEGTEAIVSRLTSEETKSYYISILTKSRLLIVVVGELNRSFLEQKISAMLSLIPTGSPFILKKEIYSPTKNTFTSEKKDLATNYIKGITGGPNPGTEDYNAFSLGMRIFYDRNFLEVRSNNGLSYAPYSYFAGGLTSSAGIGVSTTQPDKYISVVKNLVEKTKKDGFSAEEVKNMKTTYLTGFYYRQETNDAQAASLAVNQVLHNNWHRALTLNEDIKKITVSDVNKAFNKYLTNLTWVYQGNPAKVTPALYTTQWGTKKNLPPSKITKSKMN
ncbi:MAG: pitrilysin family protein [Ginsengibacter sp.]